MNVGSSFFMGVVSSAKRWSLSCCVVIAEQDNPILFHINGNYFVKNSDSGVGVGDQKKRMQNCNDFDRDLNVIPHESEQTSDWSYIVIKLKNLCRRNGK
jgi:hypothetical protein